MNPPPRPTPYPLGRLSAGLGTRLLWVETSDLTAFCISRIRPAVPGFVTLPLGYGIIVALWARISRLGRQA